MTRNSKKSSTHNWLEELIRVGLYEDYDDSDMDDGMDWDLLDSTPITSQKVGRNDPCPCGSGKKFKKCCGG